MRFVMDLKKAQPVESEDGLLTTLGQQVAKRYAKRWVFESVRDLQMEREYPELVGLFYDIRVDPSLANVHATDSEE